MDWNVRKRTDVTDEYVQKRAVALQHFVHKYGALNPEVDYSISTAENYTEELETKIEAMPRNIQAFASVLGFREEDYDTIRLKDLVRETHRNTVDEAARLKAVKEDINLMEETEKYIDDAFSTILDLNEPEGYVRSQDENVPEEWDEATEEIFNMLSGDDTPYIHTDGWLVPLPIRIEHRYEGIRDLPDNNARMTNQEIQTVTPGIPNIYKLFNEEE